jgi:cytochrome d ubiquinol oxidase subunit I
MWVFVFAVLGAVAANQAGWAAAEVGRQPWIVHPPLPYDPAGELVLGTDGVVHYDESLGLRTAAALSRAVSGQQVLGSIVLFGLIYALLLAVWILVLNDKIQKGPEPVSDEAPTEPEGYLSAAALRASHADSMTDSARDMPRADREAR